MYACLVIYLCGISVFSDVLKLLNTFQSSSLNMALTCHSVCGYLNKVFHQVMFKRVMGDVTFGQVLIKVEDVLC